MRTNDLRCGPVSVADFHTMEIDWTNHLDHLNGHQAYWNMVLPHTVTCGLWIDNVLVLILGYGYDGDGICTVFVIPSIHLHERHVQRYMVQHYTLGLQFLQSVCHPHRLQAVVNPDNDEHISFCEHFGFEYEGRLKGYSPTGQDALIYGKYLGGQE